MARTYADLSVEELTYLWRYSTLEESVDEAAELLVKADLATEQRGVSDDVLNAVDARLGRPLPDDLRQFYRRVTPVNTCAVQEFGCIGFQPADDSDLRWIEGPDLKEALWTTPYEHNWLKNWQSARVLTLGYTPFGDTLLWCERLDGRPDGTIVVTDHDSPSLNNPVVLGDSFAQWLARYRYFGFVEYAIAEGGLDVHKESRVSLAFLADHVRLNPECEWAKKRLAAWQPNAR